MNNFDIPAGVAMVLAALIGTWAVFVRGRKADPDEMAAAMKRRIEVDEATFRLLSERAVRAEQRAEQYEKESTQCRSEVIEERELRENEQRLRRAQQKQVDKLEVTVRKLRKLLAENGIEDDA